MQQLMNQDHACTCKQCSLINESIGTKPQNKLLIQNTNTHKIITLQFDISHYRPHHKSTIYPQVIFPGEYFEGDTLQWPFTCRSTHHRYVQRKVKAMVSSKKERERVTYTSATVRAESKTTTINRTILEIAHCCMCMECSPTWL